MEFLIYMFESLGLILGILFIIVLLYAIIAGLTNYFIGLHKARKIRKEIDENADELVDILFSEILNKIDEENEENNEKSVKKASRTRKNE